ncbi:hypothetical protein NUW58_g1342 [Xylaria curta]|uniref:Uncharacterized protein n=1 Tax=Xylaria curta TaxID=42375 RepID=A0ACC1PMP9_9PEZI|nr:hypothetical protein NUW58_g1342 [Xylaria curta]
MPKQQFDDDVPTQHDAAAVQPQVTAGRMALRPATGSRLEDGSTSGVTAAGPAAIYSDFQVAGLQRTMQREFSRASREPLGIQHGIQHGSGATDQTSEVRGSVVYTDASTQTGLSFHPTGSLGAHIHRGVGIGHGTSILQDTGVRRATSIHPSASASPEEGGEGRSLNRVNAHADLALLASPRGTCLWIIELYPGCVPKALFDALAGCGKIFSVEVFPSGFSCGQATAKVVFWNPQGADNLVARASRGQFIVGGQRPTVVWSRFTTERAPRSDEKSRVLVIEGPSNIVNHEYLKTIVFRFGYQLDDVIPGPKRDNWSCLEYRFSSVVQAEQAMKIISRVREGKHIIRLTERGWGNVQTRFSIDPCE